MEAASFNEAPAIKPGNRAATPGGSRKAWTRFNEAPAIKPGNREKRLVDMEDRFGLLQ